MLASHTDDDCRPLKRQRIAPKENGEPCAEIHPAFQPLPPHILLLSLPSLLLHPPTHPLHARSLFLSLRALRSCLELSNGADKDSECRAYVGIAEIGMRIGFRDSAIENEVENAITKALLMIQKYPSLRSFRPYLTVLSSRFALCQGKFKLAVNALRRTLSDHALSPDLPHITYTLHLRLIETFSVHLDTDPASFVKALGAAQDLHTISTRNGHSQISLLAEVIRLQLLVRSGNWELVRKCLETIELLQALGFSQSEKKESPPVKPTCPEHAKDAPNTSLHTALKIHVLIMSILFHTYAGNSLPACLRLKVLHDILDGNALHSFGSQGIIEIPFVNSPPLRLQVTHPRVIFMLGFLVSSVAKRDPVGRKPRKRVFATEGLAVIDNELKKELPMPPWTSLADMQDLYSRINKIKADLISEIVGVAIMRSEFDEAEKALARLIAHTRTHSLFSLYSARITLLHAQLSHGLHQPERALQCYQLAAHLSRKRTETPSKYDEGMDDPWINVAARAGEVWLRLGLLRSREAVDQRVGPEIRELQMTASELVKLCDGLGGTLAAIGEVIRSCVVQEYLQAKTHLKRALALATDAQDNHLCALVLSLIASHYVHTSEEHARGMLVTAEQLAAGLGARPLPANAVSKQASRDKKKAMGKSSAPPMPGEGVGNAPLRLWIGERFLEFEKRAGNEAAVARRSAINDEMRAAVARVEARAAVIHG